MTTGEKYDPYSVNFDSEHQYGLGSHNADARRELYQFSNPPYDIWMDGVGALMPLDKNATVLDIATGNGIVLDILRNRFGHEGFMLGIDKYSKNFFRSQQALINKDKIGGLSPVQFQAGDAENIHFDDKTFDAVTSFFGNYHVGRPLKAVYEAWRVLKHGGKAAVTTRGIGNLEPLWTLGGTVAEQVGAEPPRPFYSHWDIKAADEVLPSVFSEVLYRHIQDSVLEIPLDVNEPGDRLGWKKVRAAAFTLRDNMYIDPRTHKKPSEAAVYHAIDSVIWPIFIEEVNNYGHFRLRAQQGVWVLQK